MRLSVQKWYESERGWGRRFDGFTVALDHSTHEAVEKRMREKEREWYGDLVPPEYTARDGYCYVVEVKKLPWREVELLRDHGYFWTRDRKWELDRQPAAMV